MGLHNDIFYKAYLLRLWSDGPDTPWRAALECARTGVRYPFATVADLVAFLEAETRGSLPKASVMDVIEDEAYAPIEENKET